LEFAGCQRHGRSADFVELLLESGGVVVAALCSVQFQRLVPHRSSSVVLAEGGMRAESVGPPAKRHNPTNTAGTFLPNQRSLRGPNNNPIAPRRPQIIGSWTRSTGEESTIDDFEFVFPGEATALVASSAPTRAPKIDLWEGLTGAELPFADRCLAGLAAGRVATAAAAPFTDWSEVKGVRSQFDTTTKVTDAGLCAK